MGQQGHPVCVHTMLFSFVHHVSAQLFGLLVVYSCTCLLVLEVHTHDMLVV